MICIAGKNDIAVNCLEWLLEEKNIDSGLLCVCLNQQGDGIASKRSLKSYSSENNIKQLALEELYSIDDLVFISLEFDRLIKPECFASSELFNIHFSLLPEYRGMYTSAWPILNGDKYSGVSLHKIDEGIDTGDIIDQMRFEIDYHDTARDLYLNYMKYGELLFKKNFKAIAERSYHLKAQESDGSYYSRSSINYKNLQIDLQKSAEAIRNQVRAFHFREFQLPEIKGYSVDSAEVLPRKSTKEAGQVVNMENAYVDISTLDNDLRLHFPGENYGVSKNGH